MADTDKMEKAQLYSARVKTQVNGDYDYVKDGIIYMGGEGGAVMVESEDDLALLGGYQPGTIAFTAGFAKMWQLDTADAWVEVESSSGGGGGGGGGGESSALIVDAVEDGQSMVLQVEAQEIMAAYDAGRLVLIRLDIQEEDYQGRMYVSISMAEYFETSSGSGYYGFMVLFPVDTTTIRGVTFMADSPTDYPVGQSPST